MAISRRNLLKGAAALTAAGMFAGCSSSSSSTTASSSAAASTTAAASASTTAAASEDKAVTLKLASVKSVESDAIKVTNELAEKVKEASNGSITIEVYPAGQLGSQAEILEGVAGGTIDMTYISFALESFYPRAALMALMFEYTKEAQCQAVYDSDFGQSLLTDMTAQTGIRSIQMSYEGFRNIWTKEELKSLEDLKGMKIRVPEVPMFTSTFSALGANPTPMGSGEIYTSLQTNVIDGFELDHESVLNQNFYEVCKYCCLTHHSFAMANYMISEDVWNSLSANQQTILKQCIDDASADINERYFANQDSFVSQMEEKGVTFYDPNEEMLTEMQDIVNGVMTDYVSDYATEEDLNTIHEIISKV